ncbi:MAG TPA: OmpA family protein [Saprospiraceae bacterium]|nr:OmpA family protein [Saprospiraceae bacterium]
MKSIRILFTCLVLFILSVPAFAQPTPPAYFTIESAPNKAKNAYNDGVMEARQGNTAIAIGYFEQALKVCPTFIDAQLLWAGSQLKIKDYARAEEGFEKVIALDEKYQPGAFFTLALSEWEQDKFEDAAFHAEHYLKTNSPDPDLLREAKRLAANARFAATAVKNPVSFDPKPVGNGVNSPADEYLPSLTADGSTMIFTRRDFIDENFYQSEFKNGKWATAEPLEGVNTNQNEGAQHISPDGSWLVFTACNRRDDGSQGSCDLYWSQLKSGSWTKPVPFSAAINSTDWDAQPCISADGKTLFFSSMRPGGKGGRDLWLTTRQPGGKWSKPENLGPGINTDLDEQTPFLHPDGQTLYFTSDGLPGMGENDLFLVRRQPDGSWGTPQNLGYPINTKANEGTLTVSLDGRTAYFAANRADSQGGIDIYQFELPANARPQPVTYARAKVKDAVTGKPLVAKVEFTDLQSGQSYISANTKADGSFLVCLPAGKDYALNVNKEKYLFYSENFNLTETATFDKPFLLNIDLQPIEISPDAATPSSKPIALRNVFFETGSAALLASSSSELDRLTALLTEVPSLRIQINGHTDNVGDDAFNQKLSEARAKSVYDYLIAKNITGDRLKYKGFGETQPVETNDTAEGRGRNRRTEFVVW